MMFFYECTEMVFRETIDRNMRDLYEDGRSLCVTFVRLSPFECVCACIARSIFQ
jgi:hypothetical protein